VKDDAALDCIEKMIDLADELGWKVVVQENTDGQIMGMYIGHSEWVESKVQIRDKGAVH